MNLRQRGDGIVTMGVVGYGYWGPNLARNLSEMPGCRLKYICDRLKKNREKARSRHPAAILSNSFQTLVDDPEVDAVALATPVSSHFELAKQALERGKHVLVEKPLAASAAEARYLVKLAKRQGLTLMVGHTFEYSGPVVKVKEIIDSGQLGEIYYITSSRVNLGIHQPDVSVIWDLAAHDFSILFCWLGQQPIRVSALGRGCVDRRRPDVAFVNLVFPSRVIAEMQLSWLSPVKLRRTLVVGSKKMLLYDDTERVETVKIFDHGVEYREPETFGEFQLSYRTGDITSPKIDAYEPLAVELQHFIDCVRTGASPKTDGLSGLRVVTALEAAEESLRNDGRVVELKRKA